MRHCCFSTAWKARFRRVIHLVNGGHCSWQEYAQTTLDIAARLGLPLKTHRAEGHTMQGFAPFIAQRPPFSALDTALFTRLTGHQPRPWQAALEDYLRGRTVG